MTGARNNHSMAYNPDSEQQMSLVVYYMDGNIDS